MTGQSRTKEAVEASGGEPAFAPFVIWTLQRTGGTNLTNRLCKRSGLKPRQHEPFNKRRELGQITHDWIANEDGAALRAAVDAVCAEPRPIKHCVEQVPWAVSEALARASTAAGYNHLFLYRRDPLSRLLSVEYARRTGVWGPGHVHKAEHDDGAFAEPLDVSRLIEHEERCNELLRSAWDVLVDGGAEPVALAYEDVYSADEETATASLLRVLQMLQLSRNEKNDRRFIADLRGRGYQGTRDRYERFQGRDELARELKQIRKFGADSESGCNGWGLAVRVSERMRGLLTKPQWTKSIGVWTLRRKSGRRSSNPEFKEIRRKAEEAGRSGVFQQIVEATFNHAAATGGRFLQIGANDGVANDPISRHVAASGLPGTCVEPLPSAFARLQQQYAQSDRVRCIQVAIGTESGTGTLYLAHVPAADDSEREQRKAQHSSERKATFDRALALKRAQRFNRVSADDAPRYVEELEVPIMTVPDLLADWAVGEPTILQIDAEGYDWKILEQYPFATHRPALVNFETNHITAAELEAAQKLLASHGYVLFRHGRDCCALLLQIAS